VSLLLNIDTAIETSSICLSENDTLLGIKINPSQKDSAAWIHVAIKQLLEECNLALHWLDAIAVTEGPGSYTGLRVAMATVKGLCFVLQKPLITINTLQMMAAVAQNESTDLLCPMIDARRMEVFTAVFDRQLNFIAPASNLILNETSFDKFLQEHTVTFFGGGSPKFHQLIKHHNAIFKTFEINVLAMISLSNRKFINQDFADLAYSQPLYGKDFHSTIKQSL
jgi:tRNA threonylcarbamoyladenosine biosynthesis protein TsaB